MKFEIKLASRSRLGPDDNPEVDGARWEHYVEHDVRDDDDPACASFYWLRHGKNHRNEGDKCVRDLDRAAWVVDLPDLEAFVRFTGKYGPLSVHEPFYDGLRVIELVDN
jgi:hypothetical protein